MKDLFDLSKLDVLWQDLRLAYPKFFRNVY